MQENNFEKQVRQKIEELKINPSGEVWQNVAVVIAKRKKDRGIFAIALLLFLLIGSAIFIIWHQASNVKINKAVSEKNNLAKTNNNDEPIKGTNNEQMVGAANSPKTSMGAAGDRMKIIKDISKIKKISTQQKLLAVHVPVKTINAVEVDETGNNSNAVDHKAASEKVHDKINKPAYKTSQNVKMVISNSSPESPAIEPPVETNEKGVARVEKIIPVLNNIAVKKRVTGSVIKDVIGIDVIGINERLKDSLAVAHTTDYKKNDSAKRSLQLKQNREWKTGFNFSLGVAATQDGYLGIIGPGSGDASKSFDQLQSNTGLPGTGAIISYSPSKIKAGTGIVLGVFVQKNISPKTNLFIGLNYKTYSSSMMIGNRVDSGNNFSRANFFYRSGDKARYKNHFYFLELPVAFRFKLGKQNKLPLYLNSGVSISQLVGSTALQFDTRSGVYYSDNALFNKTQVIVSAGLLFSLSGHAKNPFLIGPDMNFSLTKMAKAGLYGNRHYSYFGIRVQKSIGKK